MEKVSAVMVIMVMGIVITVLISSASAENVIPVSKVTYSYAPVMGGGCKIPSPLAQGDKAHFSFEVQYEDGEPSGLFHLMDHGNATIPKIKVHSESLTTLEISENNATFTGTATVNKQSGYTFTVYVEDNGEPGWKKGDKFDISIFDPAGSEYYSANGTLEKGNIQIYASAELPMTNQPIEFDASESYDPDENIVAYRWDFDGDGVWDIEGDIVRITHSYNESGSYTVILEVEDTDGATNQTTITVNIGEEGEEEGISGDVTWNGKHTFDLEMMHIGYSPMITATAYEIINTITANVTVELRVDGVRLNETSETLTPGEHNISITAVWAPMSSGMHFISLHVRHVNDYNNWVGPTNDPTTGVMVFIKKVA